MSDDTVAITGATGKTGRNIVSTALERGRCALCAADRPPSGSESLSIGTIIAPGAAAFAGSDAAYALSSLTWPRGFPYEYAQFLADALHDVATDALSIPVTDTVQRICGRPPYTITHTQ
jgi:uncharacterized protein YbjT (DUF2867 family)